jgi:hypothetical protein
VKRVTLAAVVAALVFVPAALAQGGAPSQAYPLSFDKQFNGDTSAFQPDGNGYNSEFLSVALKAGDYITVDWSQPVGGHNELYFMAPDTNDNNWGNNNSLVERGPSSTGGDEFHYSIIRSGTYYFIFQAYQSSAGAFSITVHLRRGAKPGDVPSTARVARVGKTNRGDVSTHIPDGNGDTREFWRVLLHAGDRVHIGWAQPNGGNDYLDVLPVGTTNGNYSQVSSITERQPASNGHDAFNFVANRTGWYFLELSSSRPGAYSFAITVRHH